MVEVVSGVHGQRVAKPDNTRLNRLAEETIESEKARIGEYFTGRVVKIYEGTHGFIKLKVDTPEGVVKWSRYDKPFDWDPENNFLVEIADSHGYTKETWTQLEGDQVLLSQALEDDDSSWTLHATPPEEKRLELAQTEDSDGEDETLALPDGEDSDQSSPSERAAEELASEILAYNDEKIDGTYIQREIHRIYAENVDTSEELVVEVDTPGGIKRWYFPAPYNWEDTNPFVELAEERGYGPGNWTHLEGDTVLVKPVSGSMNGKWVMETAPVEDWMAETDQSTNSPPDESNSPFNGQPTERQKAAMGVLSGLFVGLGFLIVIVAAGM